MSTYGLVVVADVCDEAAASRLVERVTGVLERIWGGDGGPADDLFSTTERIGAGIRVSINVQGVGADTREAEFFVGIGEGRAAIFEDGDEYGVLFQLWRLTEAGGVCVYRAYVHDPDGDPEPATQARVMVGPVAAAEGAELFGVDPQFLLDLEVDASPVSDMLGVVGSPFLPWMEPLGLEWPTPEW